MTDDQLFRPKHLAYAIGVWGCGAICGPIFGPLLGGFTFQAKGWTWPLWYVISPYSERNMTK
jgi:DHA1 family multidrug resistance protein-like MFS transporter